MRDAADRPCRPTRTDHPSVAPASPDARVGSWRLASRRAPARPRVLDHRPRPSPRSGCRRSPGPDAVGRTTAILADPTRDEPATPRRPTSGASRLTTWYPAIAGHGHTGRLCGRPRARSADGLIASGSIGRWRPPASAPCATPPAPARRPTPGRHPRPAAVPRERHERRVLRGARRGPGQPRLRGHRHRPPVPGRRRGPRRPRRGLRRRSAARPGQGRHPGRIDERVADVDSGPRRAPWTTRPASVSPPTSWTSNASACSATRTAGSRPRWCVVATRACRRA